MTVRVLADRAAADQEFLQVAERYAGQAGVNIEALVADLVEAESVPALPVQRYKAFWTHQAGGLGTDMGTTAA